MTRKELIKALELCGSGRLGLCGKCPAQCTHPFDSISTITSKALLREAASQLREDDEHTLTMQFDISVSNGEDALFDVPEAHVDNAMKLYTLAQQEKVCIEECAELIQALTKYGRLTEPNTYTSALALDEARSHIIEEMAHVGVILAMLCKQFGVTQGDIDLEIYKKAKKENFDFSKYPDRFRVT